ncbi:LysR family transcriptional regulator [Cupriavidus sp. SK-4]|uniref:LysR family transcriptional regulator n=1 Tax=Cupriavidus sp. SK-4 TaxID=574750 RepID=UPI00044D17AD|nr:LysR family transcriptional regulator [Cupriavidus sp. SK-4]EYS93143.1 LysR family transcriptional regulator [Cupriavidus sp. SK-4]
MNKLSEMHAFVAVVDAGSITEAARRLGTTKSVISQRVQLLEQRLGAVLLQRGRGAAPTEAGQVFHEYCVRILAEVGEAEDAVLAANTSLRGSLRLAAPMAFSMQYLGPMLSAFSLRYPELRLDVESDDRYVNLHDGNFDVAIRMGQLPDSSLVARPIAPNLHLICASPGYLAAHGTPAHPTDLRHHEGLLYSNREPHGMWQLPVQGELQSFRIRGRLRTDSGHHLLAAACGGLGLAILPAFLAAQAIAAGELCIVLPGYQPSGGQISAVYRRSHRASPKIHALADFLAAQIGQPPIWELAIADHLASAGLGS